MLGSEYPSRKKQCQEAASLLKKSSLREASLEDLETLKGMNVDDEVIRRARHVITEIARTRDSAKLLQNKEYKRFGEYMVASHESLKNDYNVSCSELDSLVDICMGIDGVFGSRMTGAGFGGCIVTLAKSEIVDKIIENVKQKYSGHATMYVCRPSDGASRRSKN